MGFTYILLIVAMVGMWFFMSRSQKKQQQERQNVLEAMKVGDKVVTIGGLHGILAEINDTKRTVLIDCEGVFLEFDRTSIRTVTPAAPAEPEIIEPVQETTIIEETPVAENPAEPTTVEPSEPANEENENKE